MIHDAALNPIDNPVRVMMAGLIDTPRKNPKYSYFLSPFSSTYPAMLETIRAFDTAELNLRALIKS
jgi:hypothetical protein